MNELIRRLIDQVARRRERGDETVSDHRELDRRLSEGRELVFVGGVFFVEKFTLLAEQMLAEQRPEGGQLVVGFERFRNLTGNTRRRERYLTLEQLAGDAWVYGCDEPLDYAQEPPGPWPYERLVPVRVSEQDPLRWTWFIVYCGPRLSYCLVALSQVRSGLPITGQSEAREVSFRGVWTTDGKIAQAVVADLVRVVNPFYGA